ncbi:chemotaxis response regulator protein-glutamate methylesterase [Leptospira congkakensis]|uniref:Protein-glutamate methylesterase/protein-glutamine glutaminase n=1 Tax=Leptospira congkakensis TaxID=2484932 RepID=A0A4Z1AJ96_9LEPT|nr:chemotaxis response regulator protein-glutamate methylesterase [Leptospira congkakensis]TGL87148.1 chemotaxis response regulator protein-glutamate methylesterase [Leptospira congkakensis]TGL96716.1 chemotaxis response regulator protein-glutamate methylesterase [Leptospira congkakensis]TGL97565.1 chemotaxis response regulator protein-glutamate methylesterase [Leptospira congkakensis]
MIKLLIVDDQSVVRKVLAEMFAGDKNIQVVGTASNALEAKRLVPQLLPDVISLDVDMPGMSGIEFLDWLMPNFPTPVIMLSTYTVSGANATIQALERGAMDFVKKPDGTEADFLRMLEELTNKIKKFGIGAKPKQVLTNSQSKLSGLKGKQTEIKLIAIGASTGGTQALDFILHKLPNDLPPIVVVQHMPEHFTALFAQRLNQTTGLPVKEAAHGDILEQGHVYLAPGDQHLLVRRMAGRFYLEVEMFDKVSGHRPSVDVLFNSISQGKMGNHCLAILLTGMGRDGASGLKGIKDVGGRTIGQDEESCVVYGMPKEAFLLGGVEKQVSLSAIPDVILQYL